jgi:putative molybdopterin biosynthesis protein
MGRRTGADDLENRVRALREAAGLSQAELAAKAGITRQAVSAIESGGYVPNTTVALRLSRALGHSVEELFSISDISLKLGARAGAATGEWVASGGVIAQEQSAGTGVAEDQNVSQFVEQQVPDCTYRVTLARVGDELIASELVGSERFAPADGIGTMTGRTSRQLEVDLLVDAGILDRTVLILGCDPSLGLLANHVHRHAGDTRVLWRHAGSVAALRALLAGEAHIAGTHLWDPETGESNLPIVRRELAGMPVVVIAASQWQQGLMISKGNPKKIRSIVDLARSDISMVNREPGSGSRVLLDHHLAQAGLQPELVNGYDRLRRSHAEIAAAVRNGLADAGPGILATARANGLDFIPLQQERYDLVVPRIFLDERPIKAVLDTLTGKDYRREIDTLGGYDSAQTGVLIAELP